MEKRILILYENNHYITRKRLLLFNGVLFAQEIPKELNLIRMDYEVVLRLENVEIQN